MIPAVGDRRVLDLAGFDRLLEILRVVEGFELVGPTVQGGAIVHDRIASRADLPRGVGDEQAPGRYRLRARGDEQLFGWAVPAQGWKRELFPPRIELVQIRKRGRDVEVRDARPAARKLAFIGARPCEVAAIAVQDRVLALGDHADVDYAARRAAVFVVAANCGAPAGTCFCASMGTGPRARAGFDLALTELAGGAGRFVVEVGSEAGARALGRTDAPAAADADLAAADAVVEDAARRMGRSLEVRGLPERLLANLEHPRWAELATRCLGCASCTLSCPTCFCTTVEDGSDLAGENATRTRVWDSCFTVDFAYVHGGSVRPSLRARYRQWLTHKLASWMEQFGELGCVGCGRCITWCPVGIDLTVEARTVSGGA